jgi:hypothetical protein
MIIVADSSPFVVFREYDKVVKATKTGGKR